MAHLTPSNTGLNYRHMYEPFRKKEESKCERHAPDSIMGLLESHPQFTIFCGLLRDTQRYDTLLGEDLRHMTVFAPPNKAFKMLSMDLASELDMLQKQELVQYHIVDQTVATEDLKGIRARIQTLHPRESLVVEGRTQYLRIGTKPTFTSCGYAYPIVIKGDIEARNGVIHIVDAVLVPPVDPSL